MLKRSLFTGVINTLKYRVFGTVISMVLALGTILWWHKTFTNTSSQLSLEFLHLLSLPPVITLSIFLFGDSGKSGLGH
jgi:hypothetical protein